ncbi:MAG: NADH-quinone oxidoreductase subunit C [Chloroflexi bacterium]|nr:NADH-quinone oxidoreductase subunit C [Chloroflexota bacterium]
MRREAGIAQDVAEAMKRIRLDLGEDVVMARLAEVNRIELVVRPEGLLRVGAYLRDNQHTAFDYLSCISAVDLRTRIEMVYHLHSLPSRLSLRLKASIPADAPAIDSVVSIWPTANWQEREVFDLFGVTFKGHPDLRRIMLDDDFEGHPMLKSYPAPKGRRPAEGER